MSQETPTTLREALEAYQKANNREFRRLANNINRQIHQLVIALKGIEQDLNSHTNPQHTDPQNHERPQNHATRSPT